MSESAPRSCFLVERRIGDSWHVVQRVDNDEAAAQLASALARQSPVDGIRIVVEAPAADGNAETTLVWEYGGQPSGDDLPEPPHGSARARSGSSPLAHNSRSGHALGRRSQRDLGRANTFVAGMVTLSIAILATLGTEMLQLRWSALGPNANPSSWPVRRAAKPSVPPAPNRPEPLTALQQTVARRYAYMSCIAQHLTSGNAAIRAAYERGRVSAAMKTLYETQYASVRGELASGRAVIVRLSRDEGGLPVPLLDFIDNWFALGRDVLKAGSNVEDIVNPQDYCTARAAEAGYLDAWQSVQEATSGIPGGANSRPR